MSLAYKLWKIGRTLTDEEVWDSISDPAENIDGNENRYININFIISREKITDIEISEDSVSKTKLLFTKKIGGTSNAFYLYPNINIQNAKPEEKKLKLLLNTLEYGMLKYANKDNKRMIELILFKSEDLKERTEIDSKLSELKTNLNKINREKNEQENAKEVKKIVQAINRTEKELQNVKDKDKNILLVRLTQLLADYPKDNYWIWFSINNETFYELMPEVKDNWYKEPVIANNSQEGFDVFTNEEVEIGYSPDIKIFSYDQYHDSMKYRINENLSLSLESARNIKFAWMYILKNLVFYYKGLEYILIPNLVSDDLELLKTVINRLKRANSKLNKKKPILEKLNAQEKKLEKDINKLRSKKKKDDKLKLLEDEHNKVLSEIKNIDKGLIREFDEQIVEVYDFKHSITIDYLFTSINRTNLSFEIKDTIEDVIPSKIRNVVSEMSKPGNVINDLVKLGKRDRTETLLQDFFNRDELSFVLSRTQKKNSNKIFQERLYLAKLLLTENKIGIDQLMRRFEINRTYGYDKRKRLTKEGIYEWIEFSESFVKNESKIFNFFKNLDKIKG